ncbi:MAG: HAD family phosphatase [Oceanospirillaceae bacterium]
MNIKAVLFDHDGTIVDSEQAHFEMWKDILSLYNVELSHEEYTNQYAGIPTKTNAKALIEKYSLDVEAAELILAKTEITNKYLATQAFPLMSGALESVRYFYERGLKIGIVTGAGREGVNKTLVSHGLEKYICVVVSGDDVENSKPAPDCYLLAAKKLAIQPLECLAIEDTYNGSLAAIGADIKCIGVSASHDVRNKFSKTVYECSNLNTATQWISQNLLV